MAEVSRRWSPYNYVENNPIRLIDPDGMKAKGDSTNNVGADGLTSEQWVEASRPGTDPSLTSDYQQQNKDQAQNENTEEPPINLFKGLEDIKSYFYQLAENQPYKVGDGVFYIFGHSNTAYISYVDEKGIQQYTKTPEQANALFINRSTEYKKAMAAGKPITVILYGCQLGASEVVDQQGKVVSRVPLAKTFSEKYPNVTVIAANGYIGVSRINGKPYIAVIEPARGPGEWITYRGGKVIRIEKFVSGKEPTISK